MGIKYKESNTAQEQRATVSDFDETARLAEINDAARELWVLLLKREPQSPKHIEYLKTYYEIEHFTPVEIILKRDHMSLMTFNCRIEQITHRIYVHLHRKFQKRRKLDRRLEFRDFQDRLL